MKKLFTKNLLLTSILALLFINLNAQLESRKSMSALDKKVLIEKQKAGITNVSKQTTIDFSKSAASQVIYAMPTDITNPAIKITTLENFGVSATQLGSVTDDYQCMEWVDTDGDGEGIIYAVTYGSSGNKFGTIDPTTGIFTVINSSTADAIGMAWHPLTNDVYVSLWGSGTSSGFGKINLTTGVYTQVGTVPGLFTIAIDNDGICYGISLAEKFGTINLTDGTFTEIATSDLNLNYVQNMSIDRGTNNLYWVRRADVSESAPTKLLKINKLTGDLTELTTFDNTDNVESFAIIGNLPEYCPEVQNLAYSVDGANVTLTWDDPYGHIIDFETYKIFNGDVELGSTAERTFTIELDNGTYVLTVKAIYYSFGCIPVGVETEEIIVNVISECPQPTEISIINESNVYTISWVAPEEVTNPKFNLYKDGTVVLDNTELLSYTETLSQSHEWCVETICQSQGITSEQICSNNQYVGIKDFNIDNVIVSPNPATEVIYITGENITKVEVYNSVGQLLELKNTNFSSIDVSKYEKGVYYFKIFDSNNKLYNKHVVIAR